MNAKDFADLRGKFNEECEALLLTKGQDYTSNADRLSNFKEVAAMIGVSPLQVWAVYALKHWFAILNYVKRGKVESEAIESRFADERNYIDLGYGLLHDVPTQAETPACDKTQLTQAYMDGY